MLDVNDADETLAGVVPGEAALHVLEEVLRGSVRIQRTCQRRAETGEVGSTVLVEDVVRVAEDLLRVASRPLHREVEHDVDGPSCFGLYLGGERNDLLVDGLLRLGHERDELLDAALVLVAALLIRRTLVHDVDDQARVQERELTQPIRERAVVVLEHREDIGIRLERELRTRFVALADRGHRPLRDAAPVLLVPDAAFALDLEAEPLRDGVDGADADAV